MIERPDPEEPHGLFFGFFSLPNRALAPRNADVIQLGLDLGDSLEL
jgi:hypothetical protein